MASPLDAYVSKATPGNTKLPELPRLSDAIAQSGFKDGIAAFDERMAEWRTRVEQLINERLQDKEQPSAGKVS